MRPVLRISQSTMTTKITYDITYDTEVKDGTDGTDADGMVIIAFVRE